MKYPFGAITITPHAKSLINKVLETGQVSQGRLVRQFEEKFAEIVEVKEAIAVSSGTDADILALATLYDRGAKRGEEIIVPALTFIATANSVMHAGFIPVFVDVNKENYTLDPKKIEEKITEKTRAIMPVHLMGKLADMDAINTLARKYNLFVVEDAAEAHGAKYNNKCAGSIGHLGAFSTYIAHIISSVEGGIITTNDSELAEAARSLRSHGRNCACQSCVINSAGVGCKKRFNGEGMDKRFSFDRIGYSCKMNELEAAIGLGSLEIYDEILFKRRENLLYLMKEFKQFSPFLETFKEEPYEIIGPHAFPIILKENVPFSREDYTSFLQRKGIDTRDFFASIPTQYPNFSFLGHKLGDFPASEYIGKNGTHIGVHQNLISSHLDYFLESTGKFLKKYN